MRCQLSSIDGRSVFLLKAVEEEPAILEIATDDRPGTTTFPAARHRYALLVYPSTQVGVDQTLRHFINRRAATSPVRDYRADSGRAGVLDPPLGPAARGLPISQPPAGLAASLDTTVRAYRPRLGP